MVTSSCWQAYKQTLQRNWEWAFLLTWKLSFCLVAFGCGHSKFVERLFLWAFLFLPLGGTVHGSMLFKLFFFQIKGLGVSFLFCLSWWLTGTPGWHWTAASCCQNTDYNWRRNNSTVFKNRCQYSPGEIGKLESAVARDLHTAVGKEKEVGSRGF